MREGRLDKYAVRFFGRVLPVAAAVAWAVAAARAAPVTQTYAYTSRLSADANGPLDLTAELNYDTACSNAPIAVVMHQYSGSSGLFSNIRANAQRLRDLGFFAVSVAMRGREGSDGTRDSGGLEIYDIHDAVEAVKKSYPGLVDPGIVYLTGYSGGGGNVMSALTKFPDYFNAGAAFFGMSDYGYDPVDGWYFNGAGSGRQPQLRTDIGDPTLGDPDVMDRYHARASNLASVNNPYAEIHLFVNANETICPPVNSLSYRDNAVSRERYPGEFSNITVHIGQSGVYHDFNTNGIDEEDEHQYWPHNAPTASQQAAAESWFMARLLAGEIPRRALSPTGTLHVAGFVKTARFECRVGDGQEGVVRLDYALSATNLVFQAEVLSLNKQRLSRLLVDTGCFTNRAVEVYRNGAHTETFTSGGVWTTATLADGETVELREAGPAEEPPKPRLLAYYDFEAGLSDRTTNAYHGAGGGAGVALDGAVPAALAAHSREAIRLDGAGWVRLPFLNLYGRAQADGVSVSFWVRSGVTNSSWLLAEGSTSGSNPAYCFGPPNTDRFRAYVRTDANALRLNVSSAKAVFDSAWHHVVWTDRAGTGRLYIDGVPADTATFTYSPGPLTLNTTTLGALERRPSDTKYPFTGWLDDVSVWDEILSEENIAALASGASPLEVAGLLTDAAEPVRIRGVFLSGTTNLSLAFTGPTRVAAPRPWYTTNLSAGEWHPVALLSESTRASGGFHTQSFGVIPGLSSAFYKIVY